MRWELSPERAFAAWVEAGKCTESTSSFWLLLSLVVIAALLNFSVSSQQVVLCFFFLPTLYSAYHFGRRHATVDCRSVALVVLLTWMNPTCSTGAENR